MGLLNRLRALDSRACAATGIHGGFVRPRHDDESVEEHLRYLASNSGFGVARVADDVLVVLDRLAASEARVERLEQRG